MQSPKMQRQRVEGEALGPEKAKLAGWERRLVETDRTVHLESMDSDTARLVMCVDMRLVFV